MVAVALLDIRDQILFGYVDTVLLREKQQQ